MPYICDFKHYICNSKQSFCQMDDLKHSILWPLWRQLKNCGHCTSWMMYKYTIKHLYSFREEMHCIKLYCIYFKSAMCFVTISAVDTATLFCLKVTAGKETKELSIISIIFKTIFDNCFKILTIGRELVLFWPIAIIAFSRIYPSEILNVIPIHCFERFKAKVVSIMQIFYRLCLQM